MLGWVIMVLEKQKRLLKADPECFKGEISDHMEPFYMLNPSDYIKKDLNADRMCKLASFISGEITGG